jgi:hypothetical protein
VREGRVGESARDETDLAMAALYEMFDVTPVPPRRMHDGTSPITVTATDWRAQFNELWEYLVPAGGGAATRQGEVIRAAGRISRELLDNGGINWNRDYRGLRDDLIKDLASGTPVATADELAELGLASTQATTSTTTRSTASPNSPSPGCSPTPSRFATTRPPSRTYPRR